MNWKQTFIIVISILLVGIILGYLMNYNRIETDTSNKKIIDGQKRIIDSLFKEINTIKTEREKLETQLDKLTLNIEVSERNLSYKINQLKIQNNVKIDSITNSSNDQLLDGLRSRFIKK
jgi:hypothetical protein